jgi:hypothetical protein
MEDPDLDNPIAAGAAFRYGKRRRTFVPFRETKRLKD